MPSRHTEAPPNQKESVARRYYNVSLLCVELRLTLTVTLEQRRRRTCPCSSANMPRPAPACRIPRRFRRHCRLPDQSIRRSAALMTSRLCSITRTGVAGIHQALEHVEQLANILKVEAGCGLVQNVERLTGLTAMSSLASFTRCASPPESVVAGWPKRHIAQADVIQGLKLSLDLPEYSQRKPAPRPRSCQVRPR